MTRPFMRLLAGACLLGAATVSSAATVQTLNSTDEGGFWSPLGYADHTGSQAGQIGIHELAFAPMGLGGTFTNRAYLVFDLSSQTQTITAAQLRVKITGYQSVAAGNAVVSGSPPSIFWPLVGNLSETFGVFDVSTPTGSLTAPYGIPPSTPIGTPNPAGLAVWSDLGSGTSWGSFTASATSVGQFANVTLSASGVAALNASLGSQVAFGLSFIGVPLHTGFGGQLGAPLTHQGIAIDTLDTAHELVITSVPEPGVGWLVLSGCAFVMIRRMRARPASC